MASNMLSKTTVMPAGIPTNLVGAFVQNVCLDKTEGFEADGQESAKEAYIGAVLEVGVLPDSSLLARGGGQAVLQPEDDQPWQPQQLQRVLDKCLQEHTVAGNGATG